MYSLIQTAKYVRVHAHRWLGANGEANGNESLRDKLFWRGTLSAPILNLSFAQTHTNPYAACPTQLKASARFAHALLQSALCGLLQYMCVCAVRALFNHRVKTTCILCTDINILILCAGLENINRMPRFQICLKTTFFRQINIFRLSRASASSDPTHVNEE